MFDTSLLLTIGLVFFATLLGSWLRSQRQDPCLRSFDEYQVTVELNDGRIIWGRMDLATTGMELHYSSVVQDDKHLEASFVLYGREYESIGAIYRYVDELNKDDLKRRNRTINQAFHPNIPRRIARRFRNFMSTATDSFNEVLGLVIGRAKKPAGRYITDTSESYLKQISTNVIGYVGAQHDPLLERFVGKKVVIEMVEGDEVHEHVGIFKEYSADFLEVLDVQFPYKQRFQVTPSGARDEGGVRAIHRGEVIVVENRYDQPLLLMSMTCDDFELPMNAVLDAGVSIELYPPSPTSACELHVRVVRALDLVVPRTRCMIRHRAEYDTETTLTDIIFDVGVLLAPGEKEQAQETRLRKRLQLNPNDAAAAADLGCLLMQLRSYAEAETLLKLALTMENSLPDAGRRVRMELRELERRRSATTNTSVAIAPPKASETFKDGAGV